MEDEDKYSISEADSSYRQIEGGLGSVLPTVSVGKNVKIPSDEAKPKTIPRPGTGQKIYEIDPSLLAHRGHLDFR